MTVAKVRFCDLCHCQFQACTSQMCLMRSRVNFRRMEREPIMPSSIMVARELVQTCPDCFNSVEDYTRTVFAVFEHGTALVLGDPKFKVVDGSDSV